MSEQDFQEVHVSHLNSKLALWLYKFPTDNKQLYIHKVPKEAWEQMVKILDATIEEKEGTQWFNLATNRDKVRVTIFCE